jgi:hypothetical protein
LLRTFFFDFPLKDPPLGGTLQIRLTGHRNFSAKNRIGADFLSRSQLGHFGSMLLKLHPLHSQPAV